MTDTQLAAAESLYRFVDHMPCACIKNDGSWPFRAKDSPDVKQCQKCKALRAWEAVRGDNELANRAGP